MSEKLTMPGGKGSKRRPTDEEKFKANFEKIFGNPKQQKQDYENLADLQDRSELLKEQAI